MARKKLRVIVLGAGFGGLELSTILSERIGNNLDLTLIDRNDSFFLGFSKLDVMFGYKPAKSVKLMYRDFHKPGVKFIQDTILNIDPHFKSVATKNGTYNADIIVIALGADYDLSATPGLAEGGDEFYSFRGAQNIGNKLKDFEKGNIIVGVCSTPIKCPPAPSEAALLLHDYLSKKGIRDQCHISLIVPFELPIPPSYGTSKALLKAFDENNIKYIPEMMVASIDPEKRMAELYDGSELPFDLFMGIPEHVVPDVVEDCGLTIDDWIPVDKNNLKTRYPGVYAIGDVTSVGTPKAGIFSEAAAGIAAESIISDFSGKELSKTFDGKGSCYIEFGGGKVCKTDVDFFSGPYPTGIHHEASKKISIEKRQYESSRIARWFG